jgi:two-component system, NarL family, sensor histidine kinase DevS
VPYAKVSDPEKLRRLLAAVLVLTSDVELPELLRTSITEACSLVGARYGALGVLNETRTGLEQFLTVGLNDEEERATGARPTGRGVLGLLITEPVPLRLGRISEHPDSQGVPPNHPPMTSFLGVPLKVRDEVFGNLYLTEKIGAEEFSDEDEALAEALALATGVAIQNYRLHDRVRALSVLDDRDRIARDLHDRVIQRIYAVGMSLAGAARLDDLPQLHDRVERAVDDLDSTITEIRTAIFELGDASLPGGLRHAVVHVADELTPTLGTRPEVRFVGPVDNAVPPHVADHILAVVREALTNAAKHARASRCSVEINADDDVVLVEVIDNGSGIEADPAGSAGHGLINLRNRAEKLSGTFEIVPVDEGGTRLSWSVPV